MNKYFIILLLLCISVNGWADIAEESFFLKGRVFNHQGAALANKEVLLIAGKEFCFFTTDSQGFFKVEVRYLTYLSCTNTSKNSRFDKNVVQYAFQGNGDSMKFYCENEYFIAPQLWYKYYSKDSSSHHNYSFSHSRDFDVTALTEKMDIHFHSRANTEHPEIFYKKKIDSVRNYLNAYCSIPYDSTLALKNYYAYESELLKRNEIEKLNSAVQSDTLHTLKKLSQNITDALEYFVHRYQVYNKTFTSLSDALQGGLCNSYFENSRTDKIYYLRNFLSTAKEHYVIKCKGNIITAIYSE